MAKYLWLLEKKDPQELELAGEVDRFVVAAENYPAAREVAAKNAGDEGSDFWKDEGLSSCKMIGSFFGMCGCSDVIIRDMQGFQGL